MATAPAVDRERRPDTEALSRAEIGHRLRLVPAARLYAERTARARIEAARRSRAS